MDKLRGEGGEVFFGGAQTNRGDLRRKSSDGPARAPLGQRFAFHADFPARRTKGSGLALLHIPKQSLFRRRTYGERSRFGSICLDAEKHATVESNQPNHLNVVGFARRIA